MKFSVTSYSFGHYQNPDELGILGIIDKAAELGFDGIEYAEGAWAKDCDPDLPEKIRVFEIEPVVASFHAQKQATYRHYQYKINNSLFKKSVFDECVIHTRLKLDENRILVCATEMNSDEEIENYVYFAV